MNLTAEQLLELKNNYAKGIKSLGFGESKVEFRSMEEMERMIDRAERAAAPSPASRTHYPTYTSGT